MHSTIVTELDDGDRVICTAHDDGSISIHCGSSRDGNGACICIPYAAVLVTMAAIVAGGEKAAALRKIHYPETPPCDTDDTDSPAAAPPPDASQSTTEPDAPAPAGSSG